MTLISIISVQDTLYYEDIEERENGGTPQIIQTIRAAMAFWIKEYIGFEVIEKQEHIYAEKALKRFLPNKNIKVLGDTSAKRQAILSFLIYSTTNSSLTDLKTGSASYSKDKGDEPFYMWKETGHYRDKPLHGPFIATLLNDLFGIQARGGCACAGPYGHALLKIDETRSLAYRSAIQKVKQSMLHGFVSYLLGISILCVFKCQTVFFLIFIDFDILECQVRKHISRVLA